MVRQDKVAGRYAKAFAEYLKDEDKIRKVADELQGFNRLVSQNIELKRVLLSELFSEQERKGIIEDLAAKAKLSKEATRFLIVLSNMRRLVALDAIARKLKLLLLASAGTTPLEIVGANELSADEKEKIERRFAKLLGTKVEANYSVHPTLIGGLRVTAAGRTYDGSLAGWLNDFEEQLVGGRL